MSMATASHTRSGLPQLLERQPRHPILTNWLKNIPFILLHVVPLAVFWTGVDWLSLLLCAACYLVNMVGITVGYHRYFAHRSYKTSRWLQLVLACLGCTALQRGPLWWASQHRYHHRHSDTTEDVHSPVTGGLWWSHVGWVFSAKWNDGNAKAVRDLSRYPELRWLERLHWLPAVVVAGSCFLIGDWSSLVVGFFLSNLLSHHATFLVNSVCHLWGGRRYATADASRNNGLVALLTLGEGWHNNHHHYQSSANQGFFWWEVDVGFLFIRLLAVVGLVWDVRRPPSERVRSGLYLCLRNLAGDGKGQARRTLAREHGTGRETQLLSSDNRDVPKWNPDCSASTSGHYQRGVPHHDCAATNTEERPARSGRWMS